MNPTMMGLLDLVPFLDGFTRCRAETILTSYLTKRSISSCLAAISSFVAHSTTFYWLTSCWTQRRRRPMQSSPLGSQEDISNNIPFILVETSRKENTQNRKIQSRGDLGKYIATIYAPKGN